MVLGEYYMKYPLATETWTEVEKNAAKEVIDSGMCTMGKITLEFEKKFAEKFGSKYAVFSNSGSSANLLAVAALIFKKNGLKPGDEVIVPAVSWSTTYYPLQQYGLKLVFVDIGHDLNISCFEIEKAITKKTKAIMAVNLLGMPCDFDWLVETCERNNLFLIEDNCESMGAKYKGKQCGTIGDIGTYSTFFSHHICTVEGGMTVTDNEELYHIMLSVRSHGWTRHLPSENTLENKTGDPFKDSFRFILPGYNLRNNDIFSAIGIHQLDKLDGIVKRRCENAVYMDKVFNVDNGGCINGVVMCHSTADIGVRDSSWFGFSFICNSKNRDQVVKALMESNIECRPIVAGNFCKNPVIKYMDHRIVGDLMVSNMVDEQGFFIGNNADDITKEIDYFIDILKTQV